MAYDGACGELNVLENLWTSRVTSHVPLRDVSHLLSAEKVAEAIRMISECLRASGKRAPRIAVCGLNPQIAMKLLGFERGVTVQGGLPIPITTPAHGTAYDIAGMGLANPPAMRNAFELACKMSGNN